MSCNHTPLASSYLISDLDLCCFTLQVKYKVRQVKYNFHLQVKYVLLECGTVSISS